MKFFNFLLFLTAPSLILTIFAFNPSMVIASLSPVHAIKYMKNMSFTQIHSGKNPFEDFSFEVFDEKNEIQVQKEEDINPNYNVSEEFFTSKESSIVLKKDECYVKNMTHLDSATVKDIMLSPVSFKVDKHSDQPQILIMHTHTTESYVPYADVPFDPNYSFRNTDTSLNMAAVGDVMSETLNQQGYNTLHDTTLHDFPSYNGSYDKSKLTVEKYLELYPSIKVVLDIHRDAVERNGTLVNPVVTIDGTKYAQIMIISGADNGHMHMPNYKENLKFATAVQNSIAKTYPGLARPVLFDYRNYNQQLTTGSILVEVGTHGSTLTQAKNSARAFAISLSKYFDSTQQQNPL